MFDAEVKKLKLDVVPQGSLVQGYEICAMRAGKKLSDFLRDALSFDLKFDPQECDVRADQHILLVNQQGDVVGGSIFIKLEFRDSASAVVQRTADEDSMKPQPDGRWFTDAVSRYIEHMQLATLTQ
jgi:hypothetical protein